MHVRDLVELAALVAVHSPVLIHGGGRVPKASIEDYWTASRCRLDRWTRLLRRLACLLQSNADARRHTFSARRNAGRGY